MALFKREIKTIRGNESIREVMTILAETQRDLIRRDEEIRRKIKELEEKRNGV